jgi:hypothetical protein
VRYLKEVAELCKSRHKHIIARLRKDGLGFKGKTLHSNKPISALCCGRSQYATLRLFNSHGLQCLRSEHQNRIETCTSIPTTVYFTNYFSVIFCIYSFSLLICYKDRCFVEAANNITRTILVTVISTVVYKSTNVMNTLICSTTQRQMLLL